MQGPWFLAAQTIRDSPLGMAYSCCLCCTAPSIFAWLTIGALWRGGWRTQYRSPVKNR